MKARIELDHANPRIIQPLLAIEGYLHRSSLGARLLHLVKTRASQINGCAYCLDMHTKDARAEGESEQRLYALDAWRETPFFDAHLTDQELIDLTLAISNINAWNRLNIALRSAPGDYRPGMYKSMLSQAGLPS